MPADLPPPSRYIEPRSSRSGTIAFAVAAALMLFVSVLVMLQLQ